MGARERAQQAVQRITSDPSGFGASISLTSPGNVTAVVIGLHTKIFLGVDTDGNIVSSKKAHCSFSEAALILVNPDYPLRDASGEVNLKNHRIIVTDSTGIAKHYSMQSWMPDETLGLITCILEDYE